MPTAADRVDVLVQVLNRVGSAACVGLDPVVERMPKGLGSSPAMAFETFSKGVIDAVKGKIAAIKPQSACFERHGSPGIRALEQVISYAKDAGLWVILDAKRGDIGISAEHYAAAARDMGADCVTVNAYLGPSTLEPYLSAGLAIFALVRTSNPDSDLVQSVRCESGQTVAEMMAAHIAKLGQRHMGRAGVSAVGAVVGATKAADAASLRSMMPAQSFLIPGYGAQGGTLSDVRRMCRASAATPGEKGVLITASRSVLYPVSTANDSLDWQAAIRDAASDFAGEISTL